MSLASLPSIPCMYVLFAGLLCIGLVSAPQRAAAQASPLGLFDAHTDVGPVTASGTATYDAETQTYTLTGSGTSREASRDALSLVWTRVSGDFILRARAAFVDAAGSPHRALGWTARTSLAPDAAHVSATVQADGRVLLKTRTPNGDSTHETLSSIRGADVIQLKRTGTTFTMSAARHGEPFTAAPTTDLPLSDSLYVGLFVRPAESAPPARATFRNVRIVKPAPDDLVPYEDYLGSNLEILDVERGHRRIVHTSSESLQAPNWTPDGQTLIYNSNGLLYRFDLDQRTAEVLNTGFADANNNDHVLSFDGTRLGISHHAEDHDGNSIIYTLPVTGGTPTKVTSKGPSYLHGWSPDGNWLTYTGARDGVYDIYKIPAAGGDEIRLTRAEGLDDGSEYSPDGAYIYFNSERTGSMEIWRMKPDGSEPEQLTDDRFNNWFPHIAPDGEKIVFLSYLPDVAPGDHPFYQEVYLRMMPVDGGTPEVIAYVYGGQGTINVPSWSPDSKNVAFISNTGR